LIFLDQPFGAKLNAWCDVQLTRI